MSKQTKTYVFISVLAFFLGALCFYLVFGNKKPERIDIPITHIVEKATPPDTIYVEKFVNDTVYVQKPDAVQGIGIRPAISLSDDLLDSQQGSFVAEQISRPFYVSYKDFRYDKKLRPLQKPFKSDYLVRNQVWAYSFEPIDSFKTKLDINWQQFYLNNAKPAIEVNTLHSEYSGKFKGLLAGAMIVSGLYADKAYISVPALIAGGAIFIYF